MAVLVIGIVLATGIALAQTLAQRGG